MALHKDKQGVYILTKNDTIVYIGQSGDVYQRLHQHQYENVRFEADKAYVVQNSWFSNIEETLYLEMAFIIGLNPKYNRIKFDNFSMWYYSLPNNYGRPSKTLNDEIVNYNKIVANTYKHLISLNLIKDN